MTRHKPLKAVIIGVGAPTASSLKGGGHQIGYTHASALRRHHKVELTGAADISRQNLDAFLEAFPGPQGFESYQEALEAVKPDLVSICTYVGLHKEIVESCVEHGVTGILCEKPFVNSPRELGEVEGLLQSSECRLVVAHIRRYLPAYIQAKKLIDEGAIGKLTLACVGFDGWDLSEMGSHYFDLIRMFFGDEPIRHVFGQARVTSLTGYGHVMEDHAIACFEMESGGRGLIDGGSSLPFTLQGTEGMILLVSEQAFTLINKNGRQSFDYSDDPGSSWDALWDRTVEGLVNWVTGGEEPCVGVASSARTAEVNLAAYLSALRGDRIDLPLHDDLNEWPVDAIARRGSLTLRSPLSSLA